MQTLLEKLYSQQTTFGETDFSALCVHLNKHVNKRSFLVLYTNFASISSMNRQLAYLQQLNRQHRLLVVFFEDADLKAYIETELEKLHSAKIADAEEVMKYLTSVMRGEHTEEIPILCGDGCQELTQKEVGAKERLKAAELIGKRYGMFTDKVGVEGAVPVIITGDDQLED